MSPAERIIRAELPPVEADLVVEILRLAPRIPRDDFRGPDELLLRRTLEELRGRLVETALPF